MQKEFIDNKELFFRKNGFLFQKNFFDKQEKKLLIKILQRNINLRIKLFGFKTSKKKKNLNDFFKFWIKSKKINWDRRSLVYYFTYSEFFKLIRCKKIINLSSKLLNSNNLFFSPVANIRYKSSYFPWSIAKPHSDKIYWEKGEKKNKKFKFLSFWIPLTKIDNKSGGLEIFKNKRRIKFNFNIGDLLIFNPYVVHGAKLSQIKKVTCSLDFRIENKTSMTKDTKLFDVCLKSSSKNKIPCKLNEFLKKRPKGLPPKINNSENFTSLRPSGIKN